MSKYYASCATFLTGFHDVSPNLQNSLNSPTPQHCTADMKGAEVASSKITASALSRSHEAREAEAEAEKW